MLTVSDLLQLRLGKLQEAVTDWQTMAKRLQRLAEGKDGISAADLAQQAGAADWHGVNATVTREFITKTSREFSQAAAEAKTVLGLLRDTHSDLAKHKSDLQTAIDHGRTRRIRHEEDGTARYAHPKGMLGSEITDKPSQAELDAAAERVTRILWEATETDRIAAEALRGIAKNKHDFRTGGPKNLGEADARQGKKEAEYWAKKIKEGDPSEWSDKELARFNESLRNQRDNKAFTATLATSLGGEGTLRFWRDLADPPGADVEGDRAKMLAHVQDNFSMSLANATHVDTPAMDEWKRDVIAAGDKKFPLPDGIQGPYGFQIASSLMKKGKFASGFLNDYGTKLIEFEREKGKSPAYGNPGNLWGFDSRLDYPPSDKPNDPIAGFLEGLAHNPGASAAFFKGSTQGEGLEPIDNYDYLVGAKGDEANAPDVRSWPQGEDGKPAGYASLGHALESATLGYAYDDKTPEIPPMKTDAQIEARQDRTDLMRRVVDHYNSADAIDGQPGMRDSLARMAAGHVDSITRSVADFGGSSGVTTVDELLDTNNKHLVDFGSGTQNFLRALASDQDSYATVSSAQQVYGTSLMAAQGNDHDAAMNAAGYSMKVHGALDEARIEAIGKEFADEEDKRNEALENQAEWRKFAASAAIGTVVGVGAATVIPAGAAAAIAVPLAFEAGGGAADTFSANTFDWLKADEYDNRQQAVDSIDDAKKEGRRNAMAPIINYAQSEGLVGKPMEKYMPNLELKYGGGRDETDTDEARGH
ncbi:hypothetical protein [Streptomyces flavofungini]|uniref:hypothetical protein n=1 Tax=Streptomyces flavofungini TaxID=68200 RepID=UPI0025B17C5C|nr:hypothetical protein [Streptomyces flavofungini]WJV47794.1 hypothetical protein QUY26_21110 [Streptomyces flavofungini]